MVRVVVLAFAIVVVVVVIVVVEGGVMVGRLLFFVSTLSRNKRFPIHKARQGKNPPPIDRPTDRPMDWPIDRRHRLSSSSYSIAGLVTAFYLFCAKIEVKRIEFLGLVNGYML